MQSKEIAPDEDYFKGEGPNNNLKIISFKKTRRKSTIEWVLDFH